MKAEIKEFNAVRLMREIREQLARELQGKSFDAIQRYIPERVR